MPENPRTGREDDRTHPPGARRYPPPLLPSDSKSAITPQGMDAQRNGPTDVERAESG